VLDKTLFSHKINAAARLIGYI